VVGRAGRYLEIESGQLDSKWDIRRRLISKIKTDCWLDGFDSARRMQVHLQDKVRVRLQHQDKPSGARDGLLPGCHPRNCPPGMITLSGRSMPSKQAGFAFPQGAATAWSHRGKERMMQHFGVPGKNSTPLTKRLRA